MMIAIAILGMGLLLAATMFPAGWLRARELAEFTHQVNAAESAMTTLQLMTRVAGPDPTAPTPLTPSSFLGDFLPDGTAMPNPPTVHVLPMENVLVDTDAMGVMVNERVWPEGYRHDANDFETLLGAISIDETEAPWWALTLPPPGLAAPPGAQIPFQDRLIPPMPRRGHVATIAGIVADATPPMQENLEQWDKQLAGRRFAWAILYRFDEAVTDPQQTRSMTVYVVTLRRTRPDQRFVRQDPQLGAAPPEVKWTVPKALSFEDDVAFPVPWLVQLAVEGNWNAGGDPLPFTAVPSEAVANPVLTFDPDSRLIAQMLLPGSKLFDYRNGNIYEVTSHRFTGNGSDYDTQATVTLDRQVVLEDVNDNGDVDVDLGVEDVRLFWVFPPSVERVRPGQGFVTFEGQQPVVGIETRQIFMSPRVN